MPSDINNLEFENPILPHDERFYNIKMPSGVYPIEYINDLCFHKTTDKDYVFLTETKLMFTMENLSLKHRPTCEESKKEHLREYADKRLKEFFVEDTCRVSNCLMLKAVQTWADLSIVDNGVPLVYKLLHNTKHLKTILDMGISIEISPNVKVGLLTYATQYSKVTPSLINMMMESSTPPAQIVIDSMASYEICRLEEFFSCSLNKYDCSDEIEKFTDIVNNYKAATSNMHFVSKPVFENLKNGWVDFFKQMYRENNSQIETECDCNSEIVLPVYGDITPKKMEEEEQSINDNENQEEEPLICI